MNLHTKLKGPISCLITNFKVMKSRNATYIFNTHMYLQLQEDAMKRINTSNSDFQNAISPFSLKNKSQYLFIILKIN